MAARLVEEGRLRANNCSMELEFAAAAYNCQVWILLVQKQRFQGGV